MLIYKEPFLAFAPGYAHDALPNARLLYLFRDGRDVADSLVRTYDVLTDEKLANLESDEVQIGRKLGDRYVPWWVGGRDEDGERFLAASPYLRAVWMWREMVRRCGDLFDGAAAKESGRVLQIRYEDLIGDPLAHGQAIVQHLGLEMTATMRKRLAGAHPRSIGAHRQRDRAELAEAEQLAGAELLALGYPLGTGR